MVTGLGCVTPVGNDVSSTWLSLCQGRSGIGPISLFDAQSFPTRIAGEVSGFSLEDYSLELARRFATLGRNAQFCLAASLQAVCDSGFQESPRQPERTGVYLGSGEGRTDLPLLASLIHRSCDQEGGRVDRSQFLRLGIREIDPYSESEQEPEDAAAQIAELFDAQGPNSNCVTACAAAAQAIGEAAEVIRRGEADLMIAGGSHSMIHPLAVTGFCLLHAMSTSNDHPQEASRPFDRDRNGFVLSEGAGVLVLEEYEHARRRGARIHGELLGYGATADAYRVTDMHPAGRGAAAAMRSALRSARLDPSEINYLSAHGTSTEVNDRTETLAIKSVFGEEHAKRLPISSIKSMLGHLVAAGGAVEAIATLRAINDSTLPPTINYQTPDPECDLDYVPNTARDTRIENALSNSFGFGGQNVALVFGRC
ncbi:beta-ketoacyl-[acyl-carrier-protein] synthase family protein [Kolteria novifilia]|uniref:beta-ketoacyl-[acyl-carrier-protein] synthase family protein n=1 Tax=Kolteria novifilia TaxID=2527975 RepID=UPI003AF3DC2C